jgi:hypothetical protein
MLCACAIVSQASSSATVPRWVVGPDGHVRVMLYNVRKERAHLVVPGVPLDTPPRSVPRSTNTNNIPYNGGAIQTDPKIYIVFWGNWSGAGDPDGVQTYLTNFVGAIGGSAWLNDVTQYTQSDGSHVGNTAGSLAGTWNDKSTPPDLSGSNYQTLIAAEAIDAAVHFGDVSSNASYVIALPSGTQVNGFSSDYCGWHSDTSYNGATISYTNLPYLPDAGSNCGAGSVTSPGTLDGVSIVEGHEQAETETDPQPPSGWYDSSDPAATEIADKCAWTNLQDTKFTGASYPTQPLWSNATSSCTQDYIP